MRDIHAPSMNPPSAEQYTIEGVGPLLFPRQRADTKSLMISLQMVRSLRNRGDA
jgi:hypothetical protein